MTDVLINMHTLMEDLQEALEAQPSCASCIHFMTLGLLPWPRAGAPTRAEGSCALPSVNGHQQRWRNSTDWCDQWKEA